MKKNRFLWLFSLLLAANAVTYFFSCQQDEAAPLTPKPLSDKPVGERACLDDDYCSWVITAITNCSVVLCGDLLNYTGSCSIGCGTLGNDHSITVSLTANTPYTFCVDKLGSVCVHNPSTAVQAISVAVQVAGTAAINANIPIGETHCFNSDDTCTEIIDGCD